MSLFALDPCPKKFYNQISMKMTPQIIKKNKKNWTL